MTNWNLCLPKNLSASRRLIVVVIVCSWALSRWTSASSAERSRCRPPSSLVCGHCKATFLTAESTMVLVSVEMVYYWPMMTWQVELGESLIYRLPISVQLLLFINVLQSSLGLVSFKRDLRKSFIVRLQWYSAVRTVTASSRQHPSSDDCLEDKTEDYHNCSVLYCIWQCTVVCTYLWIVLKVDCWFTTTTTPQPFYSPFSGTTRVSRCQKRTSGLYGARED